MLFNVLIYLLSYETCWTHIIQSGFMVHHLWYCRLPPLVNMLTELQCRIHNPPTYKAEGHPGPLDLIVTSGSQDGLCKVNWRCLSKLRSFDWLI